jgi:hypothetical protein
MLKWIFAGLVGLVLFAGVVAFGLYDSVKQNATVEGTRAAEAYERVTERFLQDSCSSFLEKFRPRDQINSDTQYQAMCNCFADKMFEKMRDVPPEELEAHMRKDETNEKSRVILETCANQVGLD